MRSKTPAAESAAKNTTKASSKTLAEEFKNETKFHQKILKSLIKYIWPKTSLGIKVRVVTALSLLVGAKVLNVQVPFIFKGIIDDMNVDWVNQVGTASTIIGGTILAYGMARFGAVLFGELRNAIFASVAQQAIRNVALNTFNHLLRLDLGYHLSKQTGGITRAIDRGTKGISYVLTSMVFHLIPITFEISLVCGILSYNYGVNFAAVALLTMLTYSVFTIQTTTWRAKFRRNANAADNRAATVALDSLINFEAVKYFNNEKFQAAKYDKALATYESSQIKVQKSLAFLNSGQNFIFSSALTAMMYMACNGVSEGSLSVGDLVLVNQLVFQLSVPLNFLGSVYRDLKQALLDMENLFQLQDVKVKIQDKSDAKPLQFHGGEIKFENVTFGYHPSRKILQNATFTIPAGQKVAIVGPSGSGKSTILRLLFRFYDVESGRILVDGQDIRDVSIESLRKSIGVVPQDTPLFNDTIRNNIRYGRLDATDAEVEEVTRRARLSNLVEQLPEGYETKVGERGLMISGGEKQRLAISRVLLKKSPIIFFDEATSALDTETEKALLQNIHSLIKDQNSTSVFIAHRLRTVAETDKIIVLKDGAVLEEGSHQKLLADKNSFYYNLWESQETLALAEELEEEAQTIEEVIEGKKK
ncbi:hypothetical protein DV451_004707 [Geotrichum candidum]|nr:hypothetical protein DV451_004707 [Geotrichum candidum]KAF5106500.1 hypothetical protein DV453_003909 [Geotrichum candidum]KAF7501608.1 hypothetical protein DV113_000339 [Geotrichum candidum]KAI9214293.1 hypothetical protein DS838_000813 [Geotrichum bryndzae]